MDYVRPRTQEFPFWAMFVLFPIISIIVWISKKQDIVNYDYFWVPFCGVMIFFAVLRQKKSSNRLTKILLFFSCLIFLKYFIPWWIYDSITLKASLMDGKWMIYLITAILWLSIVGSPKIIHVYKYCIFFCLIYIAKALYMIGTGTLSRAGVLMEANYDGFMILIVYCFRDAIPNRKTWWDWVMILATLLTFSRTGWISFFLIIAYKAFRKNILYFAALVPIVMVLASWGAELRGESAHNLDRFVYWTQAINYFQNTSIDNVLLGATPGIPLQVEVMPEFAWTVEKFEDMHALNGIFPFMFHSTYLRLAITWGVVLALLYPFALVKIFLKTDFIPLKQLCIITLIQSFSLSALTLQNVSFLLMTTFFMCWQCDKQIRLNSKMSV